MKRRNFFRVAAGAFVAGGAGISRTRLRAQGSAPAGERSAPAKLKVDIYSRHLQWLRSADEVAAAAAEMGYDGVNITVRPYPGHVNPETVATDLPPFVNTIRKHGLLVRSITTNIADADSPNAERVVAAASALGITHYWWGTYRYDLTRPIVEQLEALKPRVAHIAALSEKYRMTAAYHTYSMPAAVGSVVWDLLLVLKDFDPKFVGFHWDTGHEAHHLNGMSELNLRAAAPYVAALAVKDYLPEQNDRAPGGAEAGRNGNAAGGRGRGGAGDPRGEAGRGAGPALTSGNGWRTRPVPLGTGLVNLPQIAAILKDIRFAGPTEIQAEYPNGGADNAQDAITLPREQVLGAMKRDLDALRREFAASGLL
jgi:sugar phosphate isomerase/epimerase